MMKLRYLLLRCVSPFDASLTHTSKADTHGKFRYQRCHKMPICRQCIGILPCVSVFKMYVFLTGSQ